MFKVDQKGSSLESLKANYSNMQNCGLGGVQAIVQRAWPRTIAGDVLGECHTPCTMESTFVDFEKEWLVDAAGG